eukprot:m.123570 g.123570  ORF g.123570 m.123570 type:complete len:212 (+) comp16255_c0_seq1:64-699(+)
MGALFAKPPPAQPASRVTDYDRAIHKLKVQRDKLTQYQKKVAATISRETQIVKDLVHAGDKEKARAVLKRRKYREKILSDTDAQINNLEQMTATLEYSHWETKVVEGLEAGNKALATLQETLSPEKVDALMDETKDRIDQANEIAEIVAGKLSSKDEDDLEAEYNKLLSAEELELPEAPTHALPQTPETVAAEPAKKTPAKQTSQPALVPA